MTLIEQNAMIAKFMGYEYFPFDETKKSTNPDVIVDQMNGWHKPTNGHYKMEGWYLARTSKDLAYHRNWSWLMPVIYKIFEASEDIKTFSGQGVFEMGFGISIEEAHAEVVEYIEWYNKNKING